MKPKIWKDGSFWYMSYQLNQHGLNDTVRGINFSTWELCIQWLQRYHKVIQWPTKPSVS